MGVEANIARPVMTFFGYLFPLQVPCSTDFTQQELRRRCLMLLDQFVLPLEAGDYMLQCLIASITVRLAGIET